MKSRTSFFKSVALKKDILRFAPIWALYLIGMMMILLEVGHYQDYDRFARNFLPDSVAAFGIVNLCYAGICANLLFGDLYNTKLCYSLHAMPYRRESWLVTHLVSGLLFSLVPNSIACLYMMYRLEGYWFLALLWLLAVTLQFLFFYGLATVSAMLTGNRFAMLAVYAGFNFVAMLLYATVNVIYIPMLTGVVTNLTDFSRFSPVVYLFEFDYFQFTRKEYNTTVDKYIYEVEYFYQFDGLSDGWGYLAILGILGVAVMGVALWLYRKRHLESAGDFVAFPRLKGIACIIITMCVALCFALLGVAMGSGYILWLAVGLIVGFFGSLMLLERRLKVFRKRTFLGFGALALAVTLSVLAIHCDWFGIESWTPEADKVQSVTVSNNQSEKYYNYLSTTLEDEYDISQIILAHEDILDRVDDQHGDRYTVYLTYKMKSGRTVVRSYYAPATGEGYQIVRRYLYNTNSVLGFADAETTAENISYLYTNFGEVPPALYATVLKALQIDCTNDFVLPEHGAEYYIEYNFINSEGKSVYRSLGIHKDAVEIGKLMKSPEFIMGYSDWAEFLERIENVTLSGTGFPSELPEDQWEGLLNALRKDIEVSGMEANKYISSHTVIVGYNMRTGNGRKEYREFYLDKNAKYTVAWLQEQGYIPKPET